MPLSQPSSRLFITLLLSISLPSVRTFDARQHFTDLHVLSYRQRATPMPREMMHYATEEPLTAPYEDFIRLRNEIRAYNNSDLYQK